MEFLEIQDQGLVLESYRGLTCLTLSNSYQGDLKDQDLRIPKSYVLCPKKEDHRYPDRHFKSRMNESYRQIDRPNESSFPVMITIDVSSMILVGYLKLITNAISVDRERVVYFTDGRSLTQ